MSRVPFDANSPVMPLIQNQETVLAVTQAACTLISGQPDLSPHEAVGDVLQIRQYVEELLSSPMPVDEPFRRRA